MRADYLHICVVLDASGSMELIASDTKGSFNGFIEAQKNTKGKTVFELWQFNNVVKQTVLPTDLSALSRNLMKRYFCSGCTAMNDAICVAIDDLGQRLAAMPEGDRPGNVLFAIITDGMENASQTFSGSDVKNRIECQRDVYAWDFVFLAANQDAFVTGERLGLKQDNCVNFEATAKGMRQNRILMTEAAAEIRARR